MEKPEKKNVPLENDQVKATKKTIHLINQTLKNPWDEFWNRIDSIIKKVIFSIDSESIQDTLVQMKNFNEICNFLNGLFKEIQIKKFYNNIPKTTLSAYSKKNLWNQFINNIYGKERKIFYRDEITWWDCYYRTVFLKNLFDTLQSKWLDIQNRIFVYDENRWHSSVIIKFQWEVYLADYGLFNHAFGKIISPIDDLDGLYQMKGFTKVSFNRNSDIGVRYFDDTKKFVDYLSNKKINSAAIEFTPRLEEWKEKNIRIVLFKKYISLRINGQEKKYMIKDNFQLSHICKNPHEVLTCLLRWVIASKEEKHEINIYFDIIRNKLNPQKIYEIFS